MKNNSQIADWLSEFSEVLQLKGEVNFKIIAYQKAAEAVRENTRQLEDIYKEGGLKALQEIEGIGQGISEKIEEFFKTGKVEELEQIKKKFPKNELEYLKIPGVGPATARALTDKLGNLSIDKLATKLSREGDKYFKIKSLKKLLQGIEIYRNLGDRMLLSEADQIAESLVKFIKENCDASKVVAVGSLRRRKDSVGDIDIIATSLNPKKTIDCFESFPSFSKIIGKGETKLTAILSIGKEVDLEILPEEKYGSLLLHFTGSKSHNVHLRTIAGQKKLSLSEHGFKQKTGKIILCPEEEDVYGALGMQFIEPELREDRGEIEAALRHDLPKLVELKDIQGDLHIHSNWSDGELSIAEIAKLAGEKNYGYIAISDHTTSLGIANGLSDQEFSRRLKEIEEVRHEYPSLLILNACEVNILTDGSLDVSNENLEKFDLVIASVHGGFNQSKPQMTTRILKAIKNPYVRVLGHPTGRLIGKRKGYEADWPEIFKACAKNHVALEINSFPYRLDLTDNLIIEARKYKNKFVVNTDAHKRDNFDYMKYGISIARRGWLAKSDIINTSKKQTLIKWLVRKS